MKPRNVKYVPKKDGSEKPWIGFGATQQDYEMWIPHVCGVCCLKMAGDTVHKTEDYTLYDLTMACLREGAFRITETGEIEGIFHYPLSRVAQTLGIPAVVDGHISEDKILQAIALGRFVMLSIDLAKVRPLLKGSHLVLVYSYIVATDTFLLHDCSSVIGKDGCNVQIRRQDLAAISNRKGLILG